MKSLSCAQDEVPHLAVLIQPFTYRCCAAMSMTNCQFFINLLYPLGNYDDAVVLALLLALDADDQPVRSSATKLSQIHLDHSLSDDRVRRATDRLVEQGLVRTRVYPNRWTEYTVDVQALTELLDRPLPEAPYMPGLSKEPIGFLTRRAALAAKATSPASATETHIASTLPEDDQ